MSESTTLAGWRRRAGQTLEPSNRRPLKAVVTVACAALACAVLAGRAVTPDTGAARPSPATAGPPPCPAVATALRADVDGDGCDDALSFSDGVLVAGPARMRLGGAGDQVAVGRWTCGAPTVALLRPATGEVFRFDGWATARRAVPAVALGRVDGAVAIHAAPKPQSECDELVVTRHAGAPVMVTQPPVAG